MFKFFDNDDEYELLLQWARLWKLAFGWRSRFHQINIGV